MHTGRVRLWVSLAAAIATVSGVSSVALPARAESNEPYFRISALPPQTSGLQAQAIGDPPFPLADTFRLHSVPGADRVIYLDFNGETLTNTAWNQSYGQSTINAVAFDTDSDPATFSDSERATIQSAWQRVAEDFAPYAIDVTTEDPGFDAINRAGSSDLKFGTRALITNMTTGADTCGCGGVGYIGTFDSTSNHAYYQPALIFQRGVGSSAKNVGEVVSHEVGHNLGLDHDGTSTSGYYSGHGAWAPIMGSGYTKPVTQFSKGEYSGADNPEDDFAVIASNGAPFVTDDVGDTTATAATVTGTTAAAAGIISAATDRDVFALQSTGGSVTVQASPAAVGANLDIKLDVLGADGTQLATDDPAVVRVNSDIATGLDASVTVTVPAGGFYVRVQGAGYGSAATTGYSNFASVGRYSIAASGALGTPPVIPPVTPPVITLGDVIVGEGNTGTANAVFPLTLSAASATPVTVVATTSNGTALAGSDYTATTQTITVPAGQTSASVAVPVVGDTAPEPHEKFSVTLSNPSGATLGDGVGEAVIINDDGLGVSISDVSKLEGSSLNSFTFTIRLSAPATSTVSVRVSMGNGSATSGVDYYAFSARTITFYRGQQTKTVSVTVRGDRTRELDEQFTLWLSSPVGLFLADPMGVGTIVNDD